MNPKRELRQIKCRKYLAAEDVMEFFLNKETNTCEYVLDLMCKDIKIQSDKTLSCA